MATVHGADISFLICMVSSQLQSFASQCSLPQTDIPQNLVAHRRYFYYRLRRPTLRRTYSQRVCLNMAQVTNTTVTPSFT